MGIEQLDQLGEIGERTGQAVDLVHHHDLDLAGPHLGEQRLQCRPIERGAGEAAVSEAVGQKPPALAGLAADISFASLSLSIERGEGKVEVMLGRFAGVDRKAGNPRLSFKISA